MRDWLNREILRRPTVWAVTLLAFLALWAVSSAMASHRAHKEKERALAQARTVHFDTQRVLRELRRRGMLGLDSVTGDPFDGLASARQCARQAGIQDRQMNRLESPKVKKLKNGDILHRETYKLSYVQLANVAKFIDFAENGFPDVSCYDVSLLNLKVKDKKDRWEATIYLAYLVK